MLWFVGAGLPANRMASPSLYRGAFLPDDAGEPWSVATRERLRGKFIHALASGGEKLEASGATEAAVERYLLGVDADPIVEAFYLGLMRCYLRLGRSTEAINAYRRLRQTLSVVLGVAPSERTQAVYQEIMAAMPLATGDAAEPAGPVGTTRSSRSSPSRRKPRAARTQGTR